MKYYLLFILLFKFTECYRILVCYSFPGKSLNILGVGIVRHLVDAGHDVTYITPFPVKEKHALKYRQIDISSIQGFFSNESIMNIGYVMENKNIVNDLSYLIDVTLQIAELTLNHENVKRLLNNPNEHFDAVILDHIETEVYAGFAAFYKCPMIWSYSMNPNWVVLQLVDEASNPAYTADYLSSNVPPFNFEQRIDELLAQLKRSYYKWLLAYSREEDTYQKYFGSFASKHGITLPKYEDIIYNASLLFCNSHYALGNVPKTPQNVKLIAGFHINPKPLSEELQALMDTSKNGVIYFSMGSTWESKGIPKAITEGLLKMFGELKQTVIWKYEDNLENVPKNVHIIKWAPQSSILAHPNCLFFITHGGLLSSTEAIHFGVPIIGIPIYYDQFININKAVINGYAVEVELNFDMVKNLKKAITKMLGEQSYKERAKQLSVLYHDRPISPSKELIFWTEHVIRTKGAVHLRSPALLVPWYQKMYLDLIALILAVLFLVLLLIKKLVSSLLVRATKKKEE